MLELGPTLFLQIANFAILMFLLSKIIWKPLMQALDGRQKHIATQIKEAEAINEEAKTVKARYEAQMAEARTEAQQMVREATTYAEQLREKLVTEAKEEANRIVRQAERDATLEHEKAMAEVKRHLADLTVTAAAKVLQDTLDQPTQEKLMADFVRKVGEKYVN